MAQTKRKSSLDQTQGTAGDPERENRGQLLGSAMAFKVYSPVRLDQLDAEMVTAMNWRKGAGLSADGSLEQASSTEPAVVFVNHENPDEAILTSVLVAHVPNPDWRIPGPVVSPATIKEAQAHAKAGDTLSADEIQVSLRYLLGQSAK